MSKTVEFLYDFGSPTAYLASKEIPRIAERTNAKLVYKPILLGGIFKATGNQSPVANPKKAAWMFQDLQRWAAKRKDTLNFNPHFPINTLPLMRGAVALSEDPRSDIYRTAIFDAMWVDGKNMGNPAIISEVVKTADIDPEEFSVMIAAPDTKQKLVENTEYAVSRNAFGAPTFYIDDEMHFGQDRLEFVEAALKP